MRKLIAFLALSTSALAVTSIYLWTELWDARAQVELLSQASEAAAMPLARATHSQHGADLTARAQSSAHAATMSSPNDGAKTQQKVDEDRFRESARQKLAQLADATMRAQMLEEWKEANFLN